LIKSTTTDSNTILTTLFASTLSQINTKHLQTTSTKSTRW